MRQAVIAALFILAPTVARAESVYEFVVQCREDQLTRCFNLIEERLDGLKASEDGRAFCLPKAWGSSLFHNVGYPVSVLEHVRLRMSASRFGGAERPADIVLGEILGGIYPCQ